jgi:hypothetical protein
LFDHLDRNHAALKAAVVAVPEAQQSVRPAPDRWSVAEVVQHLAILETRISKTLADKLAEARAAGLGPEHDVTPVIDPADLAMLLDRSRRATAPDPAQPKPGVTTAAAMATLDGARARLRDVVLGGDGLALGPLTFYRWVVFMGGHEARHTAQIREIAAALPSA